MQRKFGGNDERSVNNFHAGAFPVLRAAVPLWYNGLKKKRTTGCIGKKSLLI